MAAEKGEEEEEKEEEEEEEEEKGREKVKVWGESPNDRSDGATIGRAQ